MLKCIFVILVICSPLAAHVIITSLSGGYYNASSPCLSALIHFNTTNSKGSTYHLNILSPLTFETDDCISYESTGVCYVHVEYRLVDGFETVFKITEKSKNGTEIASLEKILVRFIDIYGPFFNLSLIPEGDGMKITWSTVTNKCTSESINYLQYVICETDIHSRNFSCKPPRETPTTGYKVNITCVRKNFRVFNCASLLHEKIQLNTSQKIKLRYSFGYDHLFSKWSEYGVYNPPTIDTPTLECTYDKDKWTSLKWKVFIPKFFQSYMIYVYQDGVILEQKKIYVGDNTSYQVETAFKKSLFRIQVCGSSICSSLSDPCEVAVTQTGHGNKQNHDKTLYIVAFSLFAFTAIAFIALAVAFTLKRKNRRFVTESEVNLQDADDSIFSCNNNAMIQEK